MENKNCKYKQEICAFENCPTCCHELPSKKGCEYVVGCSIDNYECDEKCYEHEERKELQNLQNELNELKIAKKTIETTIERYEKIIEELKISLDKKK